MVGVGAVIWRGPEKLLLVQRGQPPRHGEWSLPGGRVEPPRNVAATAYRYLGAGLESVVRRRGLAGGARDVYRILRRPPVP